jgi:hypothetical protein
VVKADLESATTLLSAPIATNAAPHTRVREGLEAIAAPGPLDDRSVDKKKDVWSMP